MAQERTYKWIQDRLRELHAGTLSADDRSQLDRLAQDDPFVADAMEGYHLHPDHPHDEYLKHITTRIQPYKRARRRWLIPNLTVTAVAASMILIVAIWAVINYIDKQEEHLAATETSHEIILPAYDSLSSLATSSAPGGIPPALADDTSTFKTDDLASAEDRTQPGDKSKTSRRSEVSTSDEHKKEQDVTNASRSAAHAPVQTEPTTPSAVIAGAAESPGSVTVTDDDRVESIDPMYFANQMDPDVYKRRTAGRVVSEGGEPLIGANLNIRNTNLGTVSDLDGKFELFLPTPVSTVDISFSGYEFTAVTLRQGEEDVAIKLPEANLAAESATMRKNAAIQNAKADVAASGVVNTPPDEQQGYKNYLQANSKYPLKDNLYTPGRNVTLQFNIQPDGDPNDVSIVQSSGDKKIDDEALRLIRKGPKWSCEGGKYPCEMRYTIYFR